MQTVPETLCEFFVRRGIPKRIPSDNGIEFAADAVRKLLMQRGHGSGWGKGALLGICQ